MIIFSRNFVNFLFVFYYKIVFRHLNYFLSECQITTFILFTLILKLTVTISRLQSRTIFKLLQLRSPNTNFKFFKLRLNDLISLFEALWTEHPLLFFLFKMRIRVNQRKWDYREVVTIRGLLNGVEDYLGRRIRVFLHLLRSITH